MTESLTLFVNLENLTKEEGKYYDRLFAHVWRQEAACTAKRMRRKEGLGVYFSPEEKSRMGKGDEKEHFSYVKMHKYAHVVARGRRQKEDPA